MRNKPDYGFENGLRITARDLQADSRTELGISRKELQATPRADKHLAAEVAERMANPRLIRGLGGTDLEIAIIGSENADNVTFVSYGWGGNVRHPAAVYEAQTLAANNPDSQLVFMNNFGTGNSSLLPKSVTKEIRKRGTYLPMGEYVASVFDQVAEGRTTHLRGHSLGVRTVTGVAPHLEKNPETMTLNDPTGTRNMGDTRDC